MVHVSNKEGLLQVFSRTIFSRTIEQRIVRRDEVFRGESVYTLSISLIL
jgi:hypothetical protein